MGDVDTTLGAVIADQRNDQDASLARTRPTLLERAKILMHLEATVVGYGVGQRGMTGQKDKNGCRMRILTQTSVRGDVMP